MILFVFPHPDYPPHDQHMTKDIPTSMYMVLGRI